MVGPSEASTISSIVMSPLGITRLVPKASGAQPEHRPGSVYRRMPLPVGSLSYR